MVLENICEICNISYRIEWEDLNQISSDGEFDEDIAGELEPDTCPFCKADVYSSSE